MISNIFFLQNVTQNRRKSFEHLGTIVDVNVTLFICVYIVIGQSQTSLVHVPELYRQLITEIL